MCELLDGTHEVGNYCPSKYKEYQDYEPPWDFGTYLEENIKCWQYIIPPVGIAQQKTEQKDEKKCDDCTADEICVEGKKIYKDAPCPYHRTKSHYRPFKDTDELIKVWKEKSKQVHSEYSLTMPYIWVRRKEANSKGQLITEFDDELHVSMGKEGYNMTDLFVHFTFLDGSPCGVEE